MIINYLIEKRSWIILFISLLLLFLFVAFLDQSIPFHSVAYIVFLSAILFTIFLISRYKIETRFYRSLTEWDDDLADSNLPEARTPFEQIVLDNITNQTEYFKQVAKHNQLMVEQEKDDLLSWIHEVKTPLTAMNLIIDRLENETKSELTYEWMRIQHLLDSQLYQKRLQFIENDLLIEKLNLKSIIYKEIHKLQNWCIQKGIGFDIDLNVPEVTSDAKWLSFMIRQLLTNAIKYSDASDVIISSSHISNGHTVLTIQDFGRGIDPRDLPRIFDKGYTSSVEHTDNAATGMGLYLAKKAAEPLMIDIGVESKSGEGTRFTLTFPINNDFVEIIGM
mgnify:FL=1